MMRAAAIASGAAALGLLHPAPRSMAADAAPPADDVEALMLWWPRISDTTEQAVFSELAGGSREEGVELRVRTVTERVELPWIGARVLYSEEFPHDDPDDVRRQVLLRLEPEAAGAVRVRQYTFRDPGRFRHLHRSPLLIRTLRVDDLETMPGCDLVLKRERVQFSGGTQGNACREETGDAQAVDEAPTRYVDYRLVVGEDLYWYRKRRFRVEDNALVEEVAGYTYFELADARLFTCRVSWAASGRREDRRTLLAADIHDQGGRARFETPDKRTLLVELHAQDWPFAFDRDALILIVDEAGREVPLASSWTQIDANLIAVDLGWLEVQCAAIVAESQELDS